MKLLVALMLAATPALAADPVLRSTGPDKDYVRLFSTTCTSDVVLAATPPPYRAEMRQSEYHAEDGKVTSGCWTALPDGTVGIIYDDGDQGRMPLSDFKVEPNA